MCQSRRGGGVGLTQPIFVFRVDTLDIMLHPLYGEVARPLDALSLLPLGLPPHVPGKRAGALVPCRRYNTARHSKVVENSPFFHSCWEKHDAEVPQIQLAIFYFILVSHGELI